MTLGLSLADGPDDTSYKQDNIDNLAGVEWHAESVDKEQLEPSSYGYDAGNDTIEHGCKDEERHCKGDEGTLETGIGEATVIVYQADGRQTEQVEEVNTNRQARHVDYKNKPTVAMRLIGMIFPFQDEPEYNSCKGRRVGIDLALDSREPEGIAEGVDKCSDKS